MATRRRARRKKFFTVDEANRALPLVRAIVRDIMDLATDLQDRKERLVRVEASSAGSLLELHREEFLQAREEFDSDFGRLVGYQHELEELGVELKDHYRGLVDFRSRRDDREIYLCWLYGEPEVCHWHELQDGFAGRQPLQSSPCAN